jgi:type 1 glutamine amidotransferase
MSNAVILYGTLGTEKSVALALADALGELGLLVQEHAMEGMPQVRVLEQTKLFVLYAGNFDGNYPEDTDLTLLSYAAKGGSILFLHGAAALGLQRFPYAHLLGGAVMETPKLSKNDYFTVETEHPIMKGVNTFALEDRACFTHIDRFVDKTILFRMNYLNTSIPAGWIVNYGLGRVIYLAPGCSAATFRDASYRSILTNSCRWLMRSI